VVAAQDEKPGIAPEAGAQRRAPTADFTIPWSVAALEPQVSLAI